MSSVARMPTGERDSTDDAIDVTAALVDGGDATPNLESHELAAVLAFPTLGRRPPPEPAALAEHSFGGADADMIDSSHPRKMATAMREPAGDAQPSQELQRTALKTALNNAIDHARMAQRIVAVLIVVLARSDRLDTMLGVPTRALMDDALRRITSALRPADRLVQL